MKYFPICNYKFLFIFFQYTPKHSNSSSNNKMKTIFFITQEKKFGNESEKNTETKSWRTSLKIKSKISIYTKSQLMSQYKRFQISLPSSNFLLTSSLIIFQITFQLFVFLMKRKLKPK